MRKNSSQSFTEKQSTPNCLPPLLKRNTDNHEIRVSCPTTRPPFIIRKKNSSFMESRTTRKQLQSCANQQNRNKLPSGHIAKAQPQNESYEDKKGNEDLALKDRDLNHEVSLCRISEGEFRKGNEGKYKKKPVEMEEVKVDKATDISVLRNLTKKSVKKRKIEECKTRKINWGSSSKNQAFELAISAIKLAEEELSTPIESLKELYIQMF